MTEHRHQAPGTRLSPGQIDRHVQHAHGLRSAAVGALVARLLARTRKARPTGVSRAVTREPGCGRKAPCGA